jgi:polyisoprenoid-binding protein YceI
MQRNRLAQLLPLFFVVALLPASAAERKVTLDPAASRASFVVGSTLHDVHGTLFIRSGEILFDDETGKASGEIVVDATRTDTGNSRRDKKMHGKVLLSERFPTFVFEPEFVKGAAPADGTGEVKLRGSMTLVGQTHPITISALVQVEDGRLEAQMEFPVPYVEWGLADPSGFLLRVAKVVEVTLEIRGTIAPKALAE